MKRLFLIFCILLIPSVAFSASSRILPTSYNESTYGNATRDYTSLATWEADTDTNLVTAADGEVLTCYDDNAPYNDAVTLEGATTSSDYFRVLRAAEGQRGTPTSGVRFAVTVQVCIDCQENYCSFHDIAAKAVKYVSAQTTTGFRTNLGAQNVRYIGCCGYESYNSHAAGNSAGFFISNFGAGNGSAYLINCVAIDTNVSPLGYGFVQYHNAFGSVSMTLYNCSAINTDRGISNVVGTGIAKNCIVQNSSILAFENITQTTCVTSGVTFDADGYHLDSADTGAIDQGTDLSGDGTFAFDDDIDGDTRSGDWDIGCDEYMSGAVTWKPIILFY